MTTFLSITSSERCKTFFSTNIAYVHIVTILFLGIASYANSLHVPLQFDDPAVVRNPLLSGSNLYGIQSFICTARWFTDITFALNRYLHGERVFGYHVINLAVHLSSASVIYLFIGRAIEALNLNFQIPKENECTALLQRFIPFTAAALFVCHPIQTQAVTYIAQRYTSLATLLYLGSLLSYLLARLSYANDSKKLQVWSWSFTCFAGALLAMKSKEIAITLPLMALLLELTLFRGKLLKNRIFLAIVVGLLLFIPLQLVYMHSTKNPGNLLNSIQSTTAETPLIPRSAYLLTQFKVVATYLRLLILPVNQNVDYDYPVYRSLFDPPVFAALLLHLTLAVLALTLFIRSHRQLISGNPATGISMRLAALSIFWFYLALSVESSVIPINDLIFEHRIYLPSVGFFMAAAACIAAIASHWPRYRTAAWGGIVLLCFVLTSASIARNRKWSSEMILWQDIVEKAPIKARARHAVGVLYFRMFLPEKALPYLVRAVELEPSTEKYWISLNSQIAIIDKFKGRCSEGMEYHDTITKVEPRHRKLWAALSHNNLGLAYEYLGNLYLAQENYQKAVKIDPLLDLAWYNLALVSARRNDTSNIAESLKKLKAINPLLEQSAVKTIQEQHSVQLIPQ